jgi:hypothetical protein
MEDFKFGFQRTGCVASSLSLYALYNYKRFGWIGLERLHSRHTLHES